jgi:hypothetical protein
VPRPVSARVAPKSHCQLGQTSCRQNVDAPVARRCGTLLPCRPATRLLIHLAPSILSYLSHIMSDETTSEPRRSARNAGKPQPPPVVKVRPRPSSRCPTYGRRQHSQLTPSSASTSPVSLDVLQRPASKRAAPADKKEDAASKKAKAEDEPTEANGEPATAADAAEPSKEVDEPAKAGDEPVKDDAEPAAAPEETEAAEKPASKGSKKLELGDVLPAITLKSVDLSLRDQPGPCCWLTSRASLIADG